MADMEVYDWDMGGVEDAQPRESALLPPGEYPFEVKRLVKERFAGSDKVPPCPRAVLQLEVDGGELGKATVFERILLYGKSGWKIATLFASLGFPTDPATGHRVVDWSAVEGRRGTARFKVREYNGSRYNEVDRFTAAGDAGAAGDDPWA